MLVVPLLLLGFSLGCARKAPMKAQPTPTLSPPVVEEAAPPKVEVPEVSEVPSPIPAPSPEVGVGEKEMPQAVESAGSSLQDIHFDFDQHNIRSEDRAILEKNGQWLKENPRVKVQIEGHCDERGTLEYNLALGERRTKSTKDYLISLGIEPDRLPTISYGEEKPLEPGHNEEAWAKNRRSHFHPLSE